jgi:hypothetical protein
MSRTAIDSTVRSRRQVEQRVQRKHRRHGVEEQVFFTQQPGPRVIDELFGDKADQVLEVGDANLLAVLLPAELIADHALRWIEQGLADNVIRLMHGRRLPETGVGKRN